MHSKKLKRRLIVNADDFGIDSAVNSGILEGFKKGILTSTSVLTCGEAYTEAEQILKANSALRAGIHLTLNEEKPLLPLDRVRSLIDESTGKFNNFGVFIRKFILAQISLKEVTEEFEAQIDKFLLSGIKPSHIDSHKHIHLIPILFSIFIDLAKKFGISRVRLPRSPFAYSLYSDRWVRATEVSILSFTANLYSSNLKKQRILFTDHCFGIIESGHLNDKTLLKILDDFPPGTSELICHPGFTSDALSSKYKWGYDWETDLNTITNPEIKKIINERDINLINYNEI